MNALLPHFRSSYLPCSLKLPAVQVFIAVWEVSHHIEPANCILRHFFIKWLLIFFYYKISREEFEPELGFEPRTSGFIARRSTTWAILVLMPAHVQISLLRRMPLLPGGAVMTLSVIILVRICLLRSYNVKFPKAQIMRFGFN